MIKVSGYAAKQAKAPLTQYSFERREPRDHDVVIDIEFSGICHSDIHQVNNGWGASTYPMVPGHEIAGIVTAVGTQVTRYKAGDRVGVGNFVDSCRKCRPAFKALNSIVSKERLGFTTQSKETEKHRPKEAILIRS